MAIFSTSVKDHAKRPQRGKDQERFVYTDFLGVLRGVRNMHRQTQVILNFLVSPLLCFLVLV